VLFTHLDLLRAFALIPRGIRQPYAVFLHGIEAWNELPARDVALLADARIRLANSRFTADRVVAERWLGIENHQWMDAHREIFARGFERYLREGRSPSDEMVTVFAPFKQWLSDIYQHLVQGAPQLTQEAREIYDRLLCKGELEKLTDEAEASEHHERALTDERTHEIAARKLIAAHYKPEEIDRLSDAWDFSKLSEEDKALAKKIRVYLGETFDIAHATRALGVASEYYVTERDKTSNSALEPGEAHPPSPQLLPAQLADSVATDIANNLSPRLFADLFGSVPLAGGWSMDDALAYWCSLGNLALVIATGNTFQNRDRAARVIDLSREALLREWRLSLEVVDKLQAVVNETQATCVKAYVSCRNSLDLHQFFTVYANRIAGWSVPFGTSTFEWELSGGKLGTSDPVQLAALGRVFVETCISAQSLLRAADVDWSELTCSRKMRA
jgi:hypothetical protein